MPWKQPSKTFVKPSAKATAKRLRRSPTDTEKLLWRYLREGFADTDTHFRRQVALGPYVVDFCCLTHRLVVEVDGPIHDGAAARAHDTVRDSYLMSAGFRIVRVANGDVIRDRIVVLDRISTALAGPTPTPYPSPQGGGDRLV